MAQKACIQEQVCNVHIIGICGGNTAVYGERKYIIARVQKSRSWFGDDVSHHSIIIHVVATNIATTIY